MTSVAQVAEKMQEIMTRRAEALGRSSGFIRRQRVFSGATFAQAVVFGWMGEPGASLSSLSQAAANVQVSVSRQGLDQRFTAEAAQFMKRLLQEALSQSVEGPCVAVEVLQRFSGVYLLDSTCIGLPATLQQVWPGCGGSQGASACLKVSVLWEMLRGELAQVELLAGKEHDQHAQAAQQPLPVGALRVADLGYFNLKVLARMSQAGEYWLTSYKNGTVLRQAGQRLEVLTYLQQQGEDQVVCDVEVGVRQRLPARLIARRVSPLTLARRQQQLADWERKKQCRASLDTWALLAWDICLTNVPPTLLTPEEALAVARYRWQIELLFKLWKNEGLLDEWRTTNPWRILCEIYGKLLALLFQHWLLLLGHWHVLDRTLTIAVHTTRHFAWQLAHALPHLPLLGATLQHLIECIQLCRTDKRQASLRRLQRFEALS